MSTADKRRGGAVGGSGTGSGHLLRTGASHPKHQPTSASSGTGVGMPAPPPRVAMVSPATSSPEGVHEATGGVTLSERKEKEKERDRDREKDKEKDKSGIETEGSPGRSTGAGTGTVNRRKVKDGLTSTALREKDEKIAYLEKEMDIMEREFQRELDKLSQNESETATFWQAKHSTLNQQYLRTDTELRLLQAKVDVREVEREELRHRLDVLRHEVQQGETENHDLRVQVRGLKDFVSTSTRSDGQTSDEVFGDGMARLGNGLQNWVIVNFRKSKIDLMKVDQATLAELNELIPMYEELAHGAKVHLLQSVASKILIEMIFNAYYVGLTVEETTHFRKMEEILTFLSPSDEPVNQWRSSTLALLRREAPERLHHETSTFTETVISRINRVLDCLTQSAAPPSEARDSGLRVLVNNSIELARLLAVQKAVFQVFMPEILPHQRIIFEPDVMEDIGGEDEEELLSREICCVVFPGVVKKGDEKGGQMQFTNVIAKARVLCSPEK